MLVSVISMLLLYLAPAEAYCVALELVRSSKEQLASEELKNMIRWYLPLGAEDRNRLH